MSYNATHLKEILKKDDIINILESLGSHGINPRDSNGIRSSCPIHKSKGNTVFTYNTDKHLYCCYGECNEDEKEGDIITLVMNCQKCNYTSAFEYICDVCNLDINLFKNNEEFILEELRLNLNSILGIYDDNNNEENNLYYGVNPLDNSVLKNIVGKKDDWGYIDSQGFKKETLDLFESGYSESEKRWLLPQRNENGILLGFDGRDITNKNKIKWKKRKGLLKNKILGRLDIVDKYIEENNKIILCEGKKDQMAIYEAGLKFVTCTYGSTLSIEQKELIDNRIDGEIIIFPDGDKAGYNLVESIVNLCYPEYLITVAEIEDGYDPADLSTKNINNLYKNRIYVEEWLKIYKNKLK